jgi:parvulin-like peptidyl-prolyl isomerase
MRGWVPAIIVPTLAVAAVFWPGCQQARKNQPPPDASRPVIKSEAELTAEREERIRAGQIVPTTSPTLAIERQPAPPRRPPPIAAPPAAIQGDILIVNDATVTVAEVLYPLREDLAELRRARTLPGFRDEARRLIRRQTQQEIGVLLIYKQASTALDEKERTYIDGEANKQLDNFTAREFGGSASKLLAHLKEHGLTKDQFRDSLKRGMVVREYTREKLLPQIQVRRDELLGFYRQNLPRYTTVESRELLLIEVPGEKFLPEGRTWDRASAAERAQAKLKATRQARAAREALDERSFEDVAKEYSSGLHVDNGGSWGLIARPLQPPYDVPSKLVFEHEAGWTSDPLETETAWYVVRCGRIEPGGQRSFTEAQDEIRADLRERRFNKLSAEYVLKLAAEATISSLDTFINAAVERAERLTRPAPVAGS